jgi:GTP-binding protein HflX
LRGDIYANCVVLAESASEEGALFRVRGDAAALDALQQQLARL